jgi:Skp family chaperone for outer membrane proteins
LSPARSESPDDGSTQALRDHVKQINEEDAQRLLPELDAEERRQKEAKAEREQRVRDAQKKLDELDD